MDNERPKREMIFCLDYNRRRRIIKNITQTVNMTIPLNARACRE